MRPLFEEICDCGKERGENIALIVIDNCCQWKKLLKEVFGENTTIKLDPLHAVKRITEEVNIKFGQKIVEDLQKCLRASSDEGKVSPDHETMKQKQVNFVAKWKSMEHEGENDFKDVTRVTCTPAARQLAAGHTATL